MNEERLIELEIKIAHQEALIEELNQALALQQGDLTQLKASLERFFKKYLERAHLEAEIGPANEKPPHY